MSNIDLVLLGLIKQKSQSAYDIKKNIEYQILNFHTITIEILDI